MKYDNQKLNEVIQLNAVMVDLLRTLNNEELKVCIDLMWEQPSIEELLDDTRHELHHPACAVYRTIMAYNAELF